VIVIESLTSAVHVSPEQSPGCVVSEIATLPLLPAAAVIVTVVAANDAVSVWLVSAANVHGFVVPLQVPPLHPDKWNPESAVAVIVIESLASAVHVSPEQSPGCVVSEIATLPLLPAAAVIVYVTGFAVKFAVSVSTPFAVNEQGLVVPVQELPVPVQPLKV
jgi:hypothetical protein